MQTIQFFLLLFLGAITLIQNAQQRTYFNERELPRSLVYLLPNEENGLSNLKDSVEEGNINRVVTILQNNIKQWSFIEAQLLEPNVNLGMPEIFIPLKHLTTTLEILGNIFFMKNDLVEAKQCLERACPLMELLPATLMENAAGERDDIGFDGNQAASDDAFGKRPSDNPHDQQRNPQNYAAECFSVLRNIYLKLYGDQLSSDTNALPPPALPTPSLNTDDSNSVYDSTEGIEFNVDSKIEELRQPFQHLRSELLMVQERGDESETFDDGGHTAGPIDAAQQLASTVSSPLSPASAPPTGQTAAGNIRDLLMSDLHGYARSGGHQRLPAGADRDESFVDGDREAQLLGLGGSATSLIAADMEIMLRKFVNEDDDGRRDLFVVARKYYEELDVNFPSMDLHEYAANMELGTVFLEVMARVVHEGFGFIAPELWQEFGQQLRLRDTSGDALSSPLSGAPSMVPSVDLRAKTAVIGANAPGATAVDRKEVPNLASPNHRFGVGIVWQMDPGTGLKKEVAVELDGSYYDSFSLQERNRLLVLSAFDIAMNLDPDEHFDLSLGFSLGVLDNDKTRHRDPLAAGGHATNEGGFYRGRSPAPSSTRDPSSKRRPRNKLAPLLDNDAAAAMFEDQTLSTIGITSAMRSSVPTLKAEDDWTLHLFLAFMIATVLIVYLSYSESRKKQRSRQTARPTPSGAGGSGTSHVGAGGKRHSSPDGFLGLFIRYLYPQYFDTDTSSAPTGEPPMDTWTFLTELSALVAQLDFVQWAVSFFVAADAGGAGLPTAAAKPLASKKASAGGASKQQQQQQQQLLQQQHAAPAAPASSVQSYFQRLVGTFTGSPSANQAPAPLASSVAVSSVAFGSSGAVTSTGHAQSAATATPSAGPTPSKAAAKSKSATQHSHHAQQAERAIAAATATATALPSPQHPSTSASLAATTSPENSDSSADDLPLPVTSRSKAAVPKGGSQAKGGLGSRASGDESRAMPRVSGGWSGSDRDDGFYSAYGISASEDEGWQAAHGAHKRPKPQLPAQSAGGRKSLDGAAKMAAAASPSVAAGVASKAAKVVASGLTQKLRSSPATETLNKPKSLSDDQTAEAQPLKLPTPAVAATGAPVSYAQRLTGAAASAPPATASSGPSYKHAVKGGAIAPASKSASSDSSVTAAFQASPARSSAAPAASTPSTAKPSVLSATNTPSMHHGLASPTDSFLTGTPYSSHSTPQHHSGAMFSPPSDPAGAPLFSNVFGPSTPSFLLSGPTNGAHQSFHLGDLGAMPAGAAQSGASSLLFPSMSATGVQLSSQFLFHDDRRGPDDAAELPLGFLSDPPLDAFATASSSPAKPSLLTQAPPPGLSLARANSSHAKVSNSITGANSGGFDLLASLPAGAAGATLFDGLRDDRAAAPSLVGAVGGVAGAEDDSYNVSNFLSNMLDDFLHPNSPVPDLFSSLPASSDSLLGSASDILAGYVSAAAADAAASGLVESDLSPDAPVFLPSSMFQPTPNHRHHQPNPVPHELDGIFNPFAFMDGAGAADGSSAAASSASAWGDLANQDAGSTRESF